MPRGLRAQPTMPCSGAAGRGPRSAVSLLIVSAADYQHGPARPGLAPLPTQNAPLPNWCCSKRCVVVPSCCRTPLQLIVCMAWPSPAWLGSAWSISARPGPLPTQKAPLLNWCSSKRCLVVPSCCLIPLLLTGLARSSPARPGLARLTACADSEPEQVQREMLWARPVPSGNCRCCHLGVRCRTRQRLHLVGVFALAP